ncbi:hypothetical protein BegalDRAFT_0869 [Beggiatoa alba B18LD]|uniref:Uncharacterized protein n=1 Tax=Beggiatoa alba B18LD TaxID=395493 RepID=I3CDT4_9GAMM|nr:hypothetical protein [Beggiatoa alba]EIJ41777.1 hypothetical protein BegalDRAFT_0869 [Beggiatoa alba B18LD]
MLMKSVLGFAFITALFASMSTFAQTAPVGMIQTDAPIIACGDVDKKDPE